MDISTEGADALIEAAETSGVKLGVIFQDRLKPGDGLLARELEAPNFQEWHFLSVN